MEIKSITGKHRDRTSQGPEPQRISRALWLTPWPSLILKSLSWIIFSKLFLHLRVSQHMTELSLSGSCTLTCQSRLSTNTGIMANHPTHVPLKWVGVEPTQWGSHKQGKMQPEDFQCIGIALCTENSVSWVEHELHGVYEHQKMDSCPKWRSHSLTV